MLSSLNTKCSFAGNGLTTAFTYTFQIYDIQNGSDIEVWLISPTGVESKLTSSYSIDTNTATVTYPTPASLMPALPSLWTLELRRVEALTQPIDITAEVSAVDVASAAQEAVDRLGMAIQQVKAEVDTGVPGPTGATGSMLSAGGITALPAKTSFATADLLLLEDSADSLKMKKIAKSDLTGTTAGKLVVLDGSGKLPAVDGSQLTGLPTPSSLSDIILRGFELVYANTTTLTVNAGSLMNGTTYVNKVANTTLTLATTSDWYDGATHTYAGGAGWNYIGVDNAGNIKFLFTNAPTKADISGNTAGTLLYYPNGSTYYRVIGAVWVHTDNTFTKAWFQDGNFIMWDVPITITSTPSVGSWSSAVSCAIGMPAISKRAYFGVIVTDVGSQGQVGLYIRPNGSTWATATQNGVNGSAAGGFRLSGNITSFTDASQQIQHQETITGNTCTIDLEGYYLNIR